MKKSFSLLLHLFIVLLLTVGCTNRKADDPRLQEIERIVQVTPTKAQEKLDSVMPKLNDMSMANRRAWELMSIRVNDKCLRDLKDDSLLRVLEDYYEDGTANERMEVYYYRAAYYRDHGDGRQSLEWLRKAATMADTTAEDFNTDIYAGIMGQLTASLMDSDNPKEALVYGKKMLALVHKVEDRGGIYNLIGSIYRILGNMDSTRFYYAKAFESFTPKMLKDPTNVYRLIKQVKFYVSEGDSATIQDYKPLLYSLMHSAFRSEIGIELGYYYYSIGKRDSARYYFEVATNGKDKVAAKTSYLRLYEMDLEEGNTQEALRHVNTHLTLRDSLDESSERERLLELSRQYDYGLMQASNAELKESAGWRGRINVVLVVAIALLIVLYIVYRKRVNRRIAHLLKKLTSTRDELSVRERELKQLQAQEAALREQTSTLQTNVEKMQQCFDEIRRQREPLMEYLRSLVGEKLPMEREDIKALGELLMTEYPEAMQLCRERKMSITTQWIYGLHLLGFSGAQIAILTRNSRQNIHNILARVEE